MAISAKFTRTLPAPSATISGGFVFLLSAGWFTQSDQGAAGSPIDGGTNSLANGGGDMKIFSDTAATTQLPIEVVSFVTGGSPVAQVWVRTPSYTAGDTITIGKDDTQTVQPAVGAAFGRDATWVDCIVASHNTISDSTGGATVTVTGSITAEVGVFGNTGGGGRNDNTTDYVTFTGISVSSEWTIMAWVDTNFGNARFASLGQIGSTGNQANLGLDGGNKATYQRNGTSPISTNNYNGGASYEFFAARESSTLNNLIWIGDGTDSTTTTYDSSFPTLDRARIFQSADDTPFGTSDTIVSEVRIFKTGLTDDHIHSIYDNQDAPDNFGTSSEYILVGGGGQNNVSSAFNLSALSFAAVLDNTPIENNVSSAFNLSALSFAAVLDNTPIENNVSSAFNLSPLSFAAVIDNASTGNSVSSAFNLSPLSFSAVLDNTPIENSVSSAFSLSPLSFAAVIDNSAAGNSVSSAFSLSALQFASVIDNTPIENSVSSAFNLSPLSFAVRVQNGELVAIVIETNSIVQSNYSRIIIQPTYSTNIKGK